MHYYIMGYVCKKTVAFNEVQVWNRGSMLGRKITRLNERRFRVSRESWDTLTQNMF